MFKNLQLQFTTKKDRVYVCKDNQTYTYPFMSKVDWLKDNKDTFLPVIKKRILNILKRPSTVGVLASEVLKKHNTKRTIMIHAEQVEKWINRYFFDTYDELFYATSSYTSIDGDSIKLLRHLVLSSESALKYQLDYLEAPLREIAKQKGLIWMEFRQEIGRLWRLHHNLMEI